MIEHLVVDFRGYLTTSFPADTVSSLSRVCIASARVAHTHECQPRLPTIQWSSTAAISNASRRWRRANQSTAKVVDPPTTTAKPSLLITHLPQPCRLPHIVESALQRTCYSFDPYINGLANIHNHELIAYQVAKVLPLFMGNRWQRRATLARG